MAAVVAAPSSGKTPAVRRELQILRSWPARTGVLGLVACTVLVPLSISSSLWLTVLAYAGIAAIAVTGLNLVLGYAGELSLGSAFFVAVGAYTAIWAGKEGAPLIVWLLAAGLIGGVVGGIVAPLAVRIRGPYLIVVTLGLVVVGNYLFSNWKSLTGGSAGIAVSLPLRLGPIDFSALTLGSTSYNRSQSICVLIWLVAALCIFVVANIVRSRSGRAMQGIRDNDLAAELSGVRPALVKTSAFVVSSALAALAGGLLAAQLQFVLPSQFDINLSIQYLSMLIVGGAATTFGPLVGALLISALPQLIQQYGGSLPFIKSAAETGGFGLTTAQFTVVCYGALLVIFLVLEPRGLAALVRRSSAAWRRGDGVRRVLGRPKREAAVRTR
jgi:branched-chain amino acid transport system permease protein